MYDGNQNRIFYVFFACIYCVFVLFLLCIFSLFNLLFNFISYVHIHLQPGNLYAGKTSDGTEDSSVDALCR